MKVCSVNKCMPRIFILPSLVLSAQFVSSHFQCKKTIIFFLTSLVQWCKGPNPLDYSTQGSIHRCELDVYPSWGNTSVIPVATTEILTSCSAVGVFVQFGCTRPHIKQSNLGFCWPNPCPTWCQSAFNWDGAFCPLWLSSKGAKNVALWNQQVLWGRQADPVLWEGVRGTPRQWG